MPEKQSLEIPANKLREFRIIPRMSQWKLALQSGVKQSRISLIENHLIHPTSKEKEKLAQALNHPIEEIFPNNDRDDTRDINSGETN